jgi:hypothetical protein
MIDDFVVFIFSHGRADNFFTLDTLKKHGYTGPVYIVIDNEDKTAQRYYDRFGDKVIMFDKSEAAKLFDVGDNFSDRRAIVYARNYSFKLAKDLGYKYFIQLEDDYIDFRYKVNSKGERINKADILSLDAVFGYLLEYYKSIPAKCIAIAQGGDFIGGTQNDIYTSLGKRRKIMNSLICSIERPFNFVGRMNDDVNTYTESARRGNLFITFPHVALQQLETQKNKGGHSDIYKGLGTYVKSFISVMYAPSCVFIRMMGTSHRRIHHMVSWNNTAPRIIRENYRKVA